MSSSERLRSSGRLRGLAGADVAKGGVLAGAVARGLQRRAAPGAVVLGYHDVCADEDEPFADPLTVGVSRLEGHLRLLRKLGMRFVTAAELADRLESGRSVDGCCVVTFDDALDGLHRHGLDVLDRLAVPAVVYVVADSLGREASRWPEVSPVMTADQLAEFLGAGHEVGSHTSTHGSLVGGRDHERLPHERLSPERLDAELGASRRALQTLTGQSVDTVAYPSGHHDDAAREAARDAGYRLGFTFLNGRVTGAEDPLRLPRLTMGRHLGTARLAYHVLRSPASWPDHQLERVGPA